MNRKLWIACGDRKSNLAQIKSLLAEGANPNPRFGSIWATNALHIAVAHSGPITAALLEAGADPNIPVYQGDGSTALHIAAQDRNPLRVRILLQAGADPNAKKEGGMTPLATLAMAAKCGTGNASLDKETEECFSLLLEAGADPNMKVDHPMPSKLMPYSKWTPLHFLFETDPSKKRESKSHLKWIEILLKHKADPSAKTESGLTPLELAKARNRPNIEDLEGVLKHHKVGVIKKMIAAPRQEVQQGCLEL